MKHEITVGTQDQNSEDRAASVSFPVPSTPAGLSPSDWYSQHSWSHGGATAEIEEQQRPGAMYMVSPQTVAFTAELGVASMCGANVYTPEFMRMSSFRKYISNAVNGEYAFTGWSYRTGNTKVSDVNPKFFDVLPSGAPSWLNPRRMEQLQRAIRRTEEGEPLRMMFPSGVGVIDAGSRPQSARWRDMFMRQVCPSRVMFTMPGGLELWNTVPDEALDEHECNNDMYFDDDTTSMHDMEEYYEDEYDELLLQSKKFCERQPDDGSYVVHDAVGRPACYDDVQCVETQDSIIWNVPSPTGRPEDYADCDVVIGLHDPKRFADMMRYRIQKAWTANADNRWKKEPSASVVNSKRRHYIMFTCNFERWQDGDRDYGLSENLATAYQVIDIMTRTEQYEKAFNARAIKTGVANNPNERYHEIGFVVIELKEKINVKS